MLKTKDFNKKNKKYVLSYNKHYLKNQRKK